jgi:hypothetical protein
MNLINRDTILSWTIVLSAAGTDAQHGRTAGYPRSDVSKIDSLFKLGADGTRGRNQVTSRSVILDEIDSVSRLEALLLVWSRRPKRWSTEQFGLRDRLHDRGC